MELDDEERDELLHLSEQAVKNIAEVRKKAHILASREHNASEEVMLALWQGFYLTEADNALAAMQLLLSRARVH